MQIQCINVLKKKKLKGNSNTYKSLFTTRQHEQVYFMLTQHGTHAENERDRTYNPHVDMQVLLQSLKQFLVWKANPW